MKHIILGVNDDKDFCQCCGKDKLKKVVWIENAETNEVKHFGVVCASSPEKGFGLELEIKSATKKFAFESKHSIYLAHQEYRRAGGKYKSDGVSLQDGGGLIISDINLFNSILKKIKEKRGFNSIK